MSDGRILIAGGDASGSAELYNPATQSFSLVTGSMTTARKFHSSILVSSGQVLIVGGVNAQDAMLNTAEVFDPPSQSFYLPPTDMQTQRALATLKLLADGKVQIIGGDADLSMEVFDPITGIFNAKALLPPNADLFGATLSTQSRTALFTPSISQDPLLQGVLTPEQLALLDRADQSITELPSRNQALVSGGITSAGQVLNSAILLKSSAASITTDKTDYAPGQIVTITGSGFQPNEQVNIYLHEFPEEYPDIFLSATANQQGNFVAADFAPQSIDLGRIFTLTAIGQTSGFVAQTPFKDNKNVTLTLTGTGTGTVTSTTTYSPQTQFNCTRSNPGPSNSGTCGPIAFTNNSAVITFSVSATGGSTIGAWTLGDPSWITVSGCASGNSSCVVNINNNAGTMSVAFNAAPTPTKLAFGVQPTNTDKDAAITPAVTVRILDSSNNLVTSSTRNVTLAIGTNPSGGTLAGTATVAAVGGIATFSNLSINNAGNGYTLIASSGSPTPALTTATSTPFNINKVNQTTLTVNAPATLTYGSTATLTATGGSGTGALSYSAGTSTGCSVAGTNSP